MRKKNFIMKKQVVALINGFGIEQKRSYAIYDSFLMPALDSFTKEMFFSTLKNECYNYESAYQLFSTGTDVLPSYLKLDSWLNDQVKLDPVMVKFKETFDSIEKNIHIFCVLSNEKTYRHIKEFLKFMNPLKQKKIYLHVILDFPFIEDYKKIDEIVRKLNYDLEETARLKIIIGKNMIENNEKQTCKDLIRLMYKKFGEQWRDLSQKFDVLEKDKIFPIDVPPFCTDSDFTLDDQDVIFFFNYDVLKVDDFITFVQDPNRFMNAGKEITGLSFLSLFPCVNTIQPIYRENTAEVYFTKNLEKIDKKALVVIDREKIKQTNYYLNGYQYKSSANLRYMASSTEDLLKEDVLKYVLNTDDNIVILNYFVDDVKNTEDLKENLRKIDKMLLSLRKICEENDYSLWITSLYGLRKEMLNEKKEMVPVDFYEKVPLIFYNASYFKKSHKLLQGNLYDFQLTLLYLLDPKLKAVPLISKKGIFG